MAPSTKQSAMAKGITTAAPANARSYSWDKAWVHVEDSFLLRKAAEIPHNIPCQIMSWQLFNPYSYRNSFHELNLASAPGNAGRKGVSKFPPSLSGLHRKAMRYFPKVAVKPGRNTLTPSTSDNFGPLKRASAAMSIRGKMLENI